MKAFFSALIVLASASAFAMPAIGDKATYQGRYEQNGQTMQFESISEVIAFEQATAVYTVRTTSVFGGQKEVAEEKVPAQDMITDVLAKEVLAKCTQYGGQSEEVTVPAGTFDTCALKNDSAQSQVTTWVALVPFGAVKQIVKNKDGTTATVELASFENGK